MFCHGVTYLVYITAHWVVYVIPLAYIDDICELAMKFISSAQAIIFQKPGLIFTGKLMLPQRQILICFTGSFGCFFEASGLVKMRSTYLPGTMQL